MQVISFVLLCHASHHYADHDYVNGGSFVDQSCSKGLDSEASDISVNSVHSSGFRSLG